MLPTLFAYRYANLVEHNNLSLSLLGAAAVPCYKVGRAGLHVVLDSFLARADLGRFYKLMEKRFVCSI